MQCVPAWCEGVGFTQYSTPVTVPTDSTDAKITHANPIALSSHYSYHQRTP